MEVGEVEPRKTIGRHGWFQCPGRASVFGNETCYHDRMTKVEIAQQALTLPERERFDLAHKLWASLEEPDAFQERHPLPGWQRQLLDERLEASAAEEGEDWEQVRAEIWPERR